MQFRRSRRSPASVSLQETLETGRDGTALTLEDTVPDDACMEEDLEHSDDAARMRALVQRLDGRERQIVLLRYGFAGQPPLTQQEVAALLHISRSYVSRLETKALGQLRAEMTARPASSRKFP